MGVRFFGYGAGALSGGLSAWGIGSWRCLVSSSLRRFCSPCCSFGLLLSQDGARTNRFSATLLSRSLGPDVNEERAEFTGNVEVVKEEFVWGKVASGGGIGWIVGARDVSCVKRPMVVFRKFQDVSEDVVGWSAGAGFSPPPLNDPPVVSIDFDVIAFARD